MKKTYQKPAVLMEDFTVTDCIAAGTLSCGVKVEDSNNDGQYESADIFINDLLSMGVFGAGLDCFEPIDDSYLSGYDKVCLHAAILMS